MVTITKEGVYGLVSQYRWDKTWGLIQEVRNTKLWGYALKIVETERKYDWVEEIDKPRSTKRSASTGR